MVFFSRKLKSWNSILFKKKYPFKMYVTNVDMLSYNHVISNIAKKGDLLPLILMMICTGVIWYFEPHGKFDTGTHNPITGRGQLFNQSTSV